MSCKCLAFPSAHLLHLPWPGPGHSPCLDALCQTDPRKKKKQTPHFFKSLLPHPIPTGCMHLDLPICYQDHRPHPSQNLQPVSSPFSSSLSFPFQQTTRFPHLFSLLLSACLPLVEQIPILHLELCDRTNQRNSNEGTDLQALNAEPRMYLRVHADEEAK